MRRLAAVGRPPADAVAAAYLVALLVAVAQVATMSDPVRTLRAAVPYALALVVAVGTRAVGPRDEVGWQRWTTVLAAAGSLLAVWLLGAFLGALPAGLGEPSGFYRVKLAVTSPLGDHNTAAGLLLPTIVAASALAVRAARWRLGLAVVTLGLVATLSRGAVVVLLGVAVIGWVVAADRRFKVLLSASACAAAALVLALAVVLDASPPAGADIGTDGALGASVAGRVDLAERGLEVGLERPVLGVGLGGFAEVAADLPAPNDHAHQLLAHALAEGGLVLLAVAVAVPAVLARRSVTSPPGAGREVLLLGGLGLVVHAQFEVLGGRVGYEVMVACLAGLAGASAASRSAHPCRRRRGPP